MEKMILSAELSKLTADENRVRTARLREYLEKKDIKFQQTICGYSGNMEISFIMPWDQVVADYVLTQYKQDCVMKITGKDLACFLYYGIKEVGYTKVTPKFKKIGHMEFITELTDLRYCDGWTYDPSNDLYFTVR